MTSLFDSNGKHVANYVGDQLCSPNGEHVGQYLTDKGVFVNKHGRYLGEITEGNRLLFNQSSARVVMDMGSIPVLSSIGAHPAPGHYGKIVMQPGRVDLDPDWSVSG